MFFGNKNLTNIQRITIVSFLIVPFLSSLISTIHIVDFFGLGNYYWMAVVLATSFEIGSIASALSITVLDKIKKWVVFSIFFILIFFQIVGNVYFSFNYLSNMLLQNPQSLNNAKEFFGYFLEMNPTDFKVYLAMLIGLPIPLISLAFLKSLVDYLGKVLNGGETVNVTPGVDSQEGEEPTNTESTNVTEVQEESTQDTIHDEEEYDAVIDTQSDAVNDIVTQEEQDYNFESIKLDNGDTIMSPQEESVENYINNLYQELKRNPAAVRDIDNYFKSTYGHSVISKRD